MHYTHGQDKRWWSRPKCHPTLTKTQLSISFWIIVPPFFSSGCSFLKDLFCSVVCALDSCSIDSLSLTLSLSDCIFRIVFYSSTFLPFLSSRSRSFLSFGYAFRLLACVCSFLVRLLCMCVCVRPFARWAHLPIFARYTTTSQHIYFHFFNKLHSPLFRSSPADPTNAHTFMIISYSDTITTDYMIILTNSIIIIIISSIIIIIILLL